MEQDIILNRLLDKYENSKHLTEPGVSNRRVMLSTEKKGFPEYRYEIAEVRDSFNRAAKALEQQGVISIEWLSRRPVIQCIILNLAKISDAYRLAGRIHPDESVRQYSSIIKSAMAEIRTPWIADWSKAICIQMEQSLKLPAVCKPGDTFLEQLLHAFVCYDAMQTESITMRTFSSICYHDSKRFEREFRDAFVKVAEEFNSELKEICAERELSQKEKLAFLGIYSRPELYELAGGFAAETRMGKTDFTSFASTGIALPSTSMDDITTIDMKDTKEVVFIENKTNYDEYLLSEKSSKQLVVFHGGFFSPQKRKLIQKLAVAASGNIRFYFWGDIDLGGFQMFYHLKTLIPSLKPMRMSENEVNQFSGTGLKRSEEYLKRLKIALKNNEFPDFCKEIERILFYGVTIEQEIFLTQIEK